MTPPPIYRFAGLFVNLGASTVLRATTKKMLRRICGDPFDVKDLRSLG
jgi:hypothetical protein